MIFHWPVYLNGNCFSFFRARLGVKPERFNQPNHGSARTQPLGTLPYEVIATTDQYQPGQQIQGNPKCALLIDSFSPF